MEAAASQIKALAAAETAPAWRDGPNFSAAFSWTRAGAFVRASARPRPRAARAGDGMSADRRPLLVINYAFPPFGGAASRRVAKLVKYLDRRGLRAVVVTAPRIVNPLLDPSQEVPASTTVLRTRSLEPAPPAGRDWPWLLRLRRLLNVPMIPDVSMLWALGAAAPAVRAARRHRPAAAMASAPEFSSFILGALVKALTGVPLILDYRDEWTLHPVKAASALGSRPRALKRRLEQALERRLGRYADRIIANTPAFRERMIAELGFDPGRVVVLGNGYDPEDFPPPADDSGPAPPDAPAIVTHLGSIDHPSMLPAELLNGLEAAAARAGRAIALRLVGNVYPELRRGLERRADRHLKIELLGFLPARPALALLSASRLNLLVPEDLPGKERYHNLKLFDYLYSRKPLLVYGARQSEIGELAMQSGIGRVVERGDSAGLALFLAEWLGGTLAVKPDLEFIAGFSYERIAARLEEMIAELSG